MNRNARMMRNVDKVLLIFVSVLSLTIAQHVFETKKLGDSEEEISSPKVAQLGNHAEKDSEGRQKGDHKKLSENLFGYKHLNKRGSETDKQLLTDFTRQKRSIISDHGYALRLQTGSNLIDRIKRLYSDYGYGSRLQAGENVASSHERGGLFGIAGPGKRSDEMADFNVLNEDMIKSKRINTDYGYGSRLQAAENVAMDWDRNGLFGVMGPGKRNGLGYIKKKLNPTKRIQTDFGYGSRAQAAENAAVSSSHGDLYGVYGPGKRSSGLVLLQETPEYEIVKRLTDYGYGSRTQAAENVAQSASGGGLFGVHGPGKRGSPRIDYIQDDFLPELDYIRKRFSSDFGYGSREQIAENLAKSSAKGKIFGVYEPGKRSN